ncbi:hypothetical protein [Caldalkalibacillus mannanilyticus]|nr:hypothetical protein [Caldalkalibacillus mannanilyticus]
MNSEVTVVNEQEKTESSKRDYWKEKAGQILSKYGMLFILIALVA